MSAPLLQRLRDLGIRSADEAADTIQALTVALRNIESRTRKHPEDTPEDDNRDKKIANKLARAALAEGPKP